MVPFAASGRTTRVAVEQQEKLVSSDSNQNSYTLTTVVDVTVDRALAFLRDPRAVGTWALGTWDTRPVGGAKDIYVGNSLFDGTVDSYFRVADDTSHGIVDYEVGSAPDALRLLVSVRVVPGEPFGYGADQCLVTLHAWRPKNMDDARWQRLMAMHDVEIVMLADRLAGKRPPGQEDR